MIKFRIEGRQAKVHTRSFVETCGIGHLLKKGHMFPLGRGQKGSFDVPLGASPDAVSRK